MSQRLKIAVIISTCMLLATTGCAPSAENDGVRVIASEGLRVLPAESLTDWVTYVDAVVVARVTAKEISPEKPSSDEEESGEGYAVQLVTFDILDTLWAPEGRARPDTTFTTGYNGFVWENGDRENATPLVEADAARFEIGGTYVLPLVDYVGLDGWGVLDPTSVLPFEDGIVGNGETILGADGRPTPQFSLSQPAQKLWGRDRDGIVETLSQTKPDPYASPYADLPAEERYQRAIRDADRDDASSDGDAIFDGD